MELQNLQEDNLFITNFKTKEIMIELTNSKGTETILIPSSIKEITEANLKAITSNINIPKNYCIVALCASTTLFNIAMSCSRNKQDGEMGVKPIMAKISEEDSKNVNANIGNRVVIDRSSVERGIQVYSNTAITINNISKFLCNDNTLFNEIITCTNKEKTIKYKAPIIVLSFKMVPICDIHGSYNDNIIIDPFKKVTNIN